MSPLIKQAAAHWQFVSPLLRKPASEADYDALVQSLDELLLVVGEDESHPLASLAVHLGDMLQAYDHVHRPLPRASGVDTLRYLMQEHGLKQSDLPEVGSQSVVSEILAGKRQLNLRQVRELARRFCVPADVFC
ncbi:transcriptional regulator [Pseudomonas tructae]|uniref:Transcriptional regulator n=1 Tax=Pseudomonas tructae TaxID=2518644 RepID=A0A411MD95_9PSED|nr:transcriptional regulator [Pseudomonas tructae]QBF24730.1 transcriptional regulator [Pseudomonas tructae]